MNNHPDDGRFFLTLPRNAQERQSLGGSDAEKQSNSRARHGLYDVSRVTPWLIVGSGVVMFLLAMWALEKFS